MEARSIFQPQRPNVFRGLWGRWGFWGVRGAWKAFVRSPALSSGLIGLDSLLTSRSLFLCHYEQLQLLRSTAFGTIKRSLSTGGGSPIGMDGISSFSCGMSPGNLLRVLLGGSLSPLPGFRSVRRVRQSDPMSTQRHQRKNSSLFEYIEN